ncbi:MAG TPA: APC family permease [Bdellovibrionota bacterium]
MGTVLSSIKRIFVGAPMATSEAQHQRLSKMKALATFSSDPLSSVAYASEEILLVLMLAGSSALYLSIPISLTIIALLFIVVFSYRQTIYEYPSGGGAYIVAHENIGELAGLTAAAALLTDYILTVSVSVAAGIAALTSAIPHLQVHSVGLCLAAILILMMANLRGIKESSTAFAAPTYAFIVAVLVMVGVGAWRMHMGTFERISAPDLPLQHGLTLFLILRAFSSGCTALTGVEAVSNGIPLFRKPESKNAATTLMAMVCILAVMFLGISYLAYYHGIVPTAEETVVSQLARSIFGTSWFYYCVQFTTMGILVLAANTAYADFPRLTSILARDRYLPRQLTSMGDRLVFSNGIVILSLLAALLIIIFHASTHALIPLYAVGVFLSFTLSQLGMVKHWLKFRSKNWQRKAALNLTGGVLTGIVTVVFAVTKFAHGAWIITLVVPLFIWIFLQIKQHYLSVGKQLSLTGHSPEQYQQSFDHTVILPISGLHRGVIEAMRYGQSISKDIHAVYVELDPEATERLKSEWKSWGRKIPLVVLPSPFRSVISPILQYVDEVRSMHPRRVITVLIPEFVTARWWGGVFHNQTALLMRAALLFKRDIVVTSVRYHLE